MAKYIKLSGKLGEDKFALIDSEDFKKVSQFKWHFDGRYAARKSPNKVYLHRFIMGNKKGDIDHINRNKLDCRKRNLRFTTRSINCLNKGKNRNNTSGYKGVTLLQGKYWMAAIGINRVNHYLGIFKNIKLAAKARREAEKKYNVI